MPRRSSVVIRAPTSSCRNTGTVIRALIVCENSLAPLGDDLGHIDLPSLCAADAGHSLASGQRGRVGGARLGRAKKTLLVRCAAPMGDALSLGLWLSPPGWRTLSGLTFRLAIGGIRLRASRRLLPNHRACMVLASENAFWRPLICTRVRILVGGSRSFVRASWTCTVFPSPMIFRSSLRFEDVVCEHGRVYSADTY